MLCTPFIFEVPGACYLHKLLGGVPIRVNNSIAWAAALCNRPFAIQKLLGRLQELLKRFAWNADASANVNRGDTAIFDKAVGGVAADGEDGSDFFNR